MSYSPLPLFLPSVSLPLLIASSARFVLCDLLFLFLKCWLVGVGGRGLMDVWWWCVRTRERGE